MKTLYLVRHAKSSWAFPELSDFDRPLKKRGLREAPMMANILQQKLPLPDRIVSSAANRAISTARLMAHEWKFPLADIVVTKDVYHAGSRDLLRMIRATNDACSRLMLVGHNPDFTYLGNQLAGTNVYNIPTSGIFCIEFAVDSWQEVESGKNILFIYPKLFRE